MILMGHGEHMEAVRRLVNQNKVIIYNKSRTEIIFKTKREKKTKCLKILVQAVQRNGY